jgi:small multidrug resistance pump
VGRPRSWGAVLLAGAVVCEVVGTSSLPASDGFTRTPATVGVVVGYALAIVLFTRALRHGVPMGVAYGTLTGCGLAAATVLGTVALGEVLTPVQAGGLGLIGAGALLLHRGERRRVPA